MAKKSKKSAKTVAFTGFDPRKATGFQNTLETELANGAVVLVKHTDIPKGLKESNEVFNSPDNRMLVLKVGGTVHQMPLGALNQAAKQAGINEEKLWTETSQPDVPLAEKTFALYPIMLSKAAGSYNYMVESA